MESRDELPSAEILKVKILEKSDARHQKQSDEENGAMVAWKGLKSQEKGRGLSKRDTTNKKLNMKGNIKYYQCHKFGHKKAACPMKAKGRWTKRDQDS